MYTASCAVEMFVVGRLMRVFLILRTSLLTLPSVEVGIRDHAVRRFRLLRPPLDLFAFAVFTSSAKVPLACVVERARGRKGVGGSGVERGWWGGGCGVDAGSDDGGIAACEG